MTRLPAHLVLPTTPLADRAAVITGQHWRITVLTERLLRLEYAADGTFEDRATQTVINRAFPVVPFTVTRHGDGVRLVTSSLELHYDGAPFSPSGLVAHLVGGRQHGQTWRFGVVPKHYGGRANLGGTARTLDDVDGPTELDDGLASMAGYAILDDSASFVLDTDGWVSPRTGTGVDLYLFAHGRDHRAALQDFYALTGPQPLIPRFALGNWWSRYHAYTAAEYTALMDRFAAENLPFSVAVIDMDWHLVDVPPEYGTGWTGYTWNRALFPDPEVFLAGLHDRGLKVALNVHPADGVRAYEDAHPALARALGLDPEARAAIPFAIADPEFLVAYLEHVHHPLEAQGVDFWWLDWQQGTHSSVAGLDPLWLLNHYHFLDSARHGNRPLTFSRYAGPGSHRYPIGFSGDTVNSWESLAFQPYFTATAANIGYGWWSHDIGGHMQGYRDGDLVTRWVQFGTFSPINRLHSTNNPFAGKEPWRFGAARGAIISDFLRLRHRLVPYLYTMNERAARLGEPVATPLYYGAPGGEAAVLQAYESPNTYFFGSELLVVPIAAPGDPGSGLGAVRTWLPAGTWTDWFTGVRYTGTRWVVLHRPLATLPVLAKAGAIVPLVGGDDLSVANPAHLHVRVFAGADGEFTLYEDDDAAAPRAVRTPITWQQAEGRLTIGPAEGAVDVIPGRRRWTISVTGIAPAEVPGLESSYDPGTATLMIEVGEHAADEPVVVRLGGIAPTDNDVTTRCFALLEAAEIPYADKDAAWAALTGEPNLARRVAAIEGVGLKPEIRGPLLELLLADA
ncbi:MAG: DUF5110 domain-containing protein [Micropruina sp.]|nr:MAG: DUF5110 domain-containing protein [Micropruina sp.]